jgi:hypothetical protein
MTFCDNGFHHTVAKKLEYKEFKTIDHLLNLKWRFYDTWVDINTKDHLLNLKWRFYDIVGIVFAREGIRVQLVDEDVIGLANDLLWYLVSNNPVYSWHP